MIKHLIPQRTVFVKDYCKRCKCDTDHIIQFESYYALHHKVTFMWYCIDCYHLFGNQSDAWISTISVADWSRMILLDSSTSEEN